MTLKRGSYEPISHLEFRLQERSRLAPRRRRRVAILVHCFEERECRCYGERTGTHNRRIGRMSAQSRRQKQHHSSSREGERAVVPGIVSLKREG